MKFTVERDALVKALAHATGVVERRNTIPILANVLIEATEDGAIGLVATDLNQQISLRLPARVETSGSSTVDAYLLHGLVREFADGAQIEFADTGNGKLAVVSGRSRATLQGLPSTDFPRLQPSESAVEVRLPAKVLRRLIAHAEFAQSKNDPTRPYLEGIRIQPLDGQLVLAATNGHCLAEVATALPEGGEELPAATLSTKFLGELQKLLDDRDEDVVLRVSDRQSVAEIGDIVLTGKLVEGSFPDWRRVIPAQNEKRLLVHRDAFAGAVRRASIICNDKTRIVKLDLTRDKLTVSATSHEFGHVAEEAPASYDDGDLSVGFNSKYLLELFAATGADELQVELSDAMSPTLFTNPADKAARWVVMPCRV